MAKPIMKKHKEYIASKLKLIPSNKDLASIAKEELKLPNSLEEIQKEIFQLRSNSTFHKKKAIKRLFFDIETSPNIGMFWRSGFKLNVNHGDIIEERRIICICWKWQHEDKVHSLEWDENQCDKSMLEEFMEVMLEAGEIIGHNSDRFDEKWVRTRCLYHRIPALPKYKSLDTIKKSKTHFNFNSNSLAYIAKFLGLEQKTDPGGMQTWRDIMFKDCKVAMKRMVDYCKNDVSVLEKVYDVINPYVNPNTNFAVLNGGDKWDCPDCGSEHTDHLKTYTTAAGTIQHTMECESCSGKFKINNTQYQKFLQDRMLKNNIN